jgi:hypothetical protein
MPHFPGLTSRPDPAAGVRGWLAFFLFSACVAVLTRVWVVGTLTLAFLAFIWRGTTLSASLAIAGALVIEASLLVLTVFGVRLILRDDARTPDFWATFLLASLPALVLFDVCLAYGEAVADGTTFGSESPGPPARERRSARHARVGLVGALLGPVGSSATYLRAQRVREGDTR